MKGYDEIYGKNSTVLLNSSDKGFKEYDSINAVLQIGMEADDDPFADIGEDTSTEDSGSFDDTPDEDGNMFDDMGSSDGFDSGGDDPWGNDGDDDMFGSDDEESKEKTSRPVLNRKETINEKFSMSNIVRAKVPTYILELRTITLSNIGILDKTLLLKDEANEKEIIIKEYRRVLEIVEAYIERMDTEVYEDLFKAYMLMWSTLLKLKEASDKLIQNEGGKK